ncbi:MAG: ester cyclase [Chitinophagales bacterium]
MNGGRTHKSKKIFFSSHKLKQPTMKKSIPFDEYFKTHDTAFLAEDAVFINMTSGDQTKGRKAIGEMLYYLYHIAFDARADVKHTIVTEQNAVLEANFTGKHIADFAGIPATGNQVSVPMCITYDLNNDGLIQEARIYMLADVLIQQLKSK